MVKQCLTLGLILLLSLTVKGQESNPFEIRTRTVINEVDTAVTSTNPIISRGTNNAEPEITNSIDIDTVSRTSFVDQRQQLLLENNPFNVTHIPIRRKSLEKENKASDQGATVEEGEQSSFTGRVNQPSNGSKFLFWIFLIQLLLVTSVLGINREFFRKMSRSISNDNFAKLIARDYNNGLDALFLISYAIFVLSLSVFLYLLTGEYTEFSGFRNYLIALAVVIAVYFIRHFFLAFMSFVFPFRKTLSYYNFMIILFNCYLGLLLIPVNILVAYAPQGVAAVAIFIGLGLVIVLYLLRLLRGSLHAYTLVRNYVFHFFLYLCACEIAPILILVRFLSNSSSI